MTRDIPYNEHFGDKKEDIGPKNTYFLDVNLDNPVKSLEIVMPDLIPADHGICDRHPERIEITGFRLLPE